MGNVHIVFRMQDCRVQDALVWAHKVHEQAALFFYLVSSRLFFLLLRLSLD